MNMIVPVVNKEPENSTHRGRAMSLSTLDASKLLVLDIEARFYLSNGLTFVYISFQLHCFNFIRLWCNLSNFHISVFTGGKLLTY